MNEEYHSAAVDQQTGGFCVWKLFGDVHSPTRSMTRLMMLLLVILWAVLEKAEGGFGTSPDVFVAIILIQRWNECMSICRSMFFFLVKGRIYRWKLQLGQKVQIPGRAFNHRATVFIYYLLFTSWFCFCSMLVITASASMVLSWAFSGCFSPLVTVTKKNKFQRHSRCL